MKAITFNEFGGPEVLTYSDVATPIPKAHEVLVKVHACALNRADILQRKGHYPAPKGASEILGLELAGEVIELGAEVSKINKGQKVFGIVAGGAYAQYAVIDEDMAMPIPENLDYLQASAVAEAFFTANETIFELGQLQAGESVLIHAGASGVGTAAIQMAASIQAKVYFTAGSTEKINKVQTLADCHGIHYQQQDFAKVIHELTDGRGVDVIEDFLGADYFEQNIQSLAPKGRLIVVAFMGGADAHLDLSQVLRKRLQIKGSVMRTQTLSEKRAITQRFMKRWYPSLTLGVIKPVVDKVFALQEATKAHQYMQSRLNVGKIVLRVEDN